MKNSLCGALVFSVASLVGCADIAQQNAQTPAQIAAQVCPPIQATLASLQALPNLSDTAQANLTLAVPIVNTACGIGATVDMSGLQALERTALPILSDLVKAAPLSPAEQDGIVAAQLVLSTAVVIADSTQSSAQSAAQPATQSSATTAAP